MTPLFFHLTVFSFVMTKKPEWIISSLRNLCTKHRLQGCVLREMWLKSKSSQNAERKKTEQTTGRELVASYTVYCEWLWAC